MDVQTMRQYKPDKITVRNVLIATFLVATNLVQMIAAMTGIAGGRASSECVISLLLLVTFGVWEHLFAKHPTMPMKIFKAPSFLPLVIVVLLSYMSFGNLQWYMVLWQQDIREWSVLQFSLGWTPFAVVGTLGDWFCRMVDTSHRSAMDYCYWRSCDTNHSICPDFIYTAAQIFASNSVSQRDQGIAGSLIGALNLYGCSLGIGFGSTVEAYVHIRTGDVLFGYRASLYFGIALVAIAILLDALLVRVKKDERQGWGVTEESHDI